MKTTILAIAASALLGSAAAGSLHERRHAYQVFHDLRRSQPSGTAENATCGCTTYVTTYYGEATLIQPAPTTFTVSPISATPSSALSSSLSSSSSAEISSSALSSSFPTLISAATALTASSSASTSSSIIIPSTTSTTSETSVSAASETSTTSSTISALASPSSSAASPKSYEVSSSAAPAAAQSSSVAASKFYEAAAAPTTSPASQSSSTEAPKSYAASSSAASAAPQSPSAEAPKTYAPGSSSAAPAAPQSSPVSSASSSSSTPSSGPPHSSAAPISSSGSQWCMTYSPYNPDTTCKSASAVSADIAAIASKGFTSVRLYSTDCNGLSTVGAAASTFGLKLVLGVFISSSGISVAAEQISAITTHFGGDYHGVEMIVIGNEAIFNNYCSPDALAAFIQAAKSSLVAAGYSGPVTTTEPMNVLQAHAPTLCPVIDVAAANIHPFFNRGTDAASAGEFVASVLAELAALCPGGKEAYNLETGWPHAGNANGVAVPGASEQEVAIASIRESAGGRSAFFSFVDDLWKAPGPDGVEQSWGCSHLFGE